MAAEKISVERFLELAETINVCDVRSPSEFSDGHIPGAFNVPLFDDREREAVGIRYKEEGRIPAILAGLDLAGPAMAGKLSGALELSVEGKLLVHCWRGGMRSEAMAWLFSLAGIETLVMEGGYKAYRNFILARLSKKRKMIILGGLTGSGKTYILRRLVDKGRQIIDLERLANHKGYHDWTRTDGNNPVWLEDESRNIGTVFMPDTFYQNIQDSPTIVLMMDMKLRIPRLLAEYSGYPPELLRSSIQKISRRLGGAEAGEAIRAVECGDYAKAVEITLRYYDKTYRYGLTKKNQSNLIFVKTDTDDIDANAAIVAGAVRKIKWQV